MQLKKNNPKSQAKRSYSDLLHQEIKINPFQEGTKFYSNGEPSTDTSFITLQKKVILMETQT
jgi:hypothetical protein